MSKTLETMEAYKAARARVSAARDDVQAKAAATKAAMESERAARAEAKRAAEECIDLAEELRAGVVSDAAGVCGGLTDTKRKAEAA